MSISTDDLFNVQGPPLRPRVTSIIPNLLDEEQWNWVVDDHDNGQDDRVLGLLRHGNTVKRIHGYFKNLEARKCCMSLAGPRTSLTNIRLVQNDSRDSGIEENASQALDTSSVTKHLSDKEFAVYKHAFLCADHPVLGAPEPPSGMTPTSTPLTKHTNAYRKSPSQSTSYEDGDSETDTDSNSCTSPVQSETLLELVRQAFGLTPERHQYYSDIIFEGCGRKQPSKLLVEELVSQLAVLENNRHPFYSPQAFLSRNSYDQWQQMERSQISELINKFWHLSLPAPTNTISKPGYWFNRHEEYISLMNRLIRFESSLKRNSVFFIPLSSSSKRLLGEFGLRYGVGELYRKAVYLEYLASNFENEVGLIKHITKIVTQIFSLVSPHHMGGKLIMTRNEFETIQQTITLLHGQCGNSLTRIKRLFPDNQPEGGLESLISLLCSVLLLKGLLSGKKQQTEHCLKQYMQESFTLAYERHKLIATTELNLNAFITQLSPRLLNILLFNIRDEVNNYRQYYMDVFMPYFNVVHLAAKAFYHLLMDDVKQLCEMSAEETNSGEVDLMMLSLAYRLNRLDADWATFILPKDQCWRSCFLLQTNKWLMVLKEHLVSLVLQSVGADKYETLKLPSAVEDFAFSSLQDCRLFGPIGTQLTQSEGSAFSSVPSSGNMSPKSPQIADELEERKKYHTSQPDPIKPLHQNYHFTPINNQQWPSQGEMERASSPTVSDTPFIINGDYKYGLRQQQQSACSGTSEDEQLFVSTNRNKCGSISKPAEANRTEVEVEVHVHPNHCDTKPSGYNSDTLTHGCVSGDFQFSDEQATVLKASGNPDARTTSERLKINGVDKRNLANNEVETPEEDISTSVMCGTVVRKPEDCAQMAGDDEQIITEDDKGNGDTNVKAPESADVKENNEENEVVNVRVIKKSGETTPTHLPDKQCNAEALQWKSTADNFDDKEPHQIFDSAVRHLTPVVDNIGCLSTHNSDEDHQGSNISSIERQEPDCGLDVTQITLTENPEEKVLPITSSLVDIICIVKRLSSFVYTMYEMLCPVHECSELCLLNGAESDLHRSAIETINRNNLKAGQQLYQRMVQAFSCTVCTYADNLLSLDICATPKVIARKLLGQQLLQHIRWQRKTNQLWGCRHMIAEVDNCYQYVSKDSQYLSDRFEPVTEQMCSRINNVSDLIALMPVFQSMLSQTIPTFDGVSATMFEEPLASLEDFVVIDDIPQIPGSVTDDEVSSSESATSTGCHSNNSSTKGRTSQKAGIASDMKSPLGSPSGGSSVGDHRTESLVDIVFGHCQWHLDCVQDSLINLLAQKINLFFKQGLSLLVELDMEGFTIEKRLKPLTEFLTNHLKALTQWLYQDCYNRLHLVLWYFITEDFEQEAYNLKKYHDKAEQKAMLLLQALSYMIEFIHDGGQGLPIEQLISPAERVMQLLQLFSWSTEKLINLYQHLSTQDQENGPRCNNSLHEPSRELLQRMRRDLHNIRKCFTGTQLIDWILKNYTEHEMGAHCNEDTHSSVDKAMKLAQRLLDLNVIHPTVTVISTLADQLENSRPESASPSSSPYPEISLHTHPSQPDKRKWTSSVSETNALKKGSTAAISVTNDDNNCSEGPLQLQHTVASEQDAVCMPTSGNVSPMLTSGTSNTVTLTTVTPCQAVVVSSQEGYESSQFDAQTSVNLDLRGEGRSAAGELEGCDNHPQSAKVISNEKHATGSVNNVTDYSTVNTGKMKSVNMKDAQRESDGGLVLSDTEAPPIVESRSATPASVHSNGSDSTSCHSTAEAQVFMNSTVHLYRFTDVYDEELYSYHSDATVYSASSATSNMNSEHECHNIRVGMQNKSIDPVFVVSVIYTRKHKDKAAKQLLKHLPKPVLEHLKGENWSSGCFEVFL